MATSPTVSGSSGTSTVSSSTGSDTTSGSASVSGSSATVSGSASAPADKPTSLELIVALFLTDWLHGDKHHSDVLRDHALKLLADLGEDGADARLRLEAAPVGLVSAPAA